jgi:HTH-type transcriptional regulator / antitoxin HigA
MATDRRYTYETDIVPAPGETIREVLAERSISQKELASLLDKSEKFVSQLLGGTAPLRPQTAVGLERVLGVPASFWSNSEALYQEWLARRNEAAKLEEQSDWLRRFPLGEMTAQGWLAARVAVVDQMRELLLFFGVASPEGWQRYWDTQAETAFRRSTAFEMDLGSLSAWLRQGELQATKIACQAYSAKAFRASLASARVLTRESPSVFVPALTDLCAEAGVAVVFVPELPRIRCSAATRWLSPEKALIQLCLRYKTDDHLWFSFFHEAAHVLSQSRSAVFLECDGDSNEEEAADRFAADVLISPQDYQRLLAMQPLALGDIEVFADDLGVSPGIVVGRLQHDGHLPWRTTLNSLKRRLRWVAVPEN